MTNGIQALRGYDLSQHDSQASYIWVSSIFFLVLIPLVMALRMYVRLRVVRALGADDCKESGALSEESKLIRRVRSFVVVCIRLRLRLVRRHDSWYDIERTPNKSIV